MFKSFFDKSNKRLMKGNGYILLDRTWSKKKFDDRKDMFLRYDWGLCTYQTSFKRHYIWGKKFV